MRAGRQRVVVDFRGGKLHPAQSHSVVFLNRLTAGALITVVFGALVFPRMQEFVPQSVWTLVWAGVGASAIALMYHMLSRPRVERSPRTHWVAAMCLALATGALAAVVGRALSYDFGWDARVVLDAAISLSSGSDLGDYPYDYFSRYPNNIPLLAIDRLIVWGASSLNVSLGTAIALCNAAAVAVISFSVFVMTQCIGGRKEAFVAQGLVVVLFGFSPWLAVPYTDLPVAALIAVSSAAVVAAMQPLLSTAAVAGLCVLSGLSAGTAISLKPTAVILLIALSTATIVGAGQGNRRAFALRTSGTVTLAVIVAILGTAALPMATGLDTSQLDSTRAFPMHHFARMGLLETPGDNGAVRYGGYDAKAVEQMGRATSVAERKAMSTDAIAARLHELGPGGYATFLAKKAVWIWSDGTFGSWVEGIDQKESLQRNGPLSTSIQQVLHPSGRYWPAWSSAVTGIWLALIASTAILLWRQAKRPELVLMSLCLVGIGAFSLLFEGRARYLIIFVPIAITLLSSLLAPVSDFNKSRVPSSIPQRRTTC